MCVFVGRIGVALNADCSGLSEREIQYTQYMPRTGLRSIIEV